MKISCPICHQNYEIEDQYVGQQFDCPSCKNRFTAEATPTAQPIKIKTNVKQGAIIGAWVCLFLGIVLNIFTNLLFFLYGPLYLAAFILGITAMAQRRVVGGVIVLILSLILPTSIITFNIARFASEISNYDNKAEKKENVSTQASQSSSTQVLESSSKQPTVPTPTATPTPKAKKILEGLCGFKFGTEFPKNNNPKNGKLTTGEIMYRIYPTKKFAGFTDYYVLTTPISQQIYSIWLSQNFEMSSVAREEFDKICTILENHYKIKGKDDYFSIDSTRTYNFDNGRIVLKLNTGLSNHTLEIRAYSDEFEELNTQEKKEIAIKTTDTSAL